MQAIDTNQPFLRILKNTANFFCGRIANALLSLIYLAVASKTLGLGDLGNLILIFSTISLLASLSNLDAWVPLQNFGTPFLKRKDYDGFFSLFAFAIRADLLSSLLGLIIGFIGIWFVGDALHEWPHELQKYALWSVLFIPFFYTDFSYGTLRLFDCYTFLGFCASFGTFFRVIGAIAGLILGYGVGYFLLVNVLAKVVILLTESAYCFHLLAKKTKRRFKFRFLFMPRPQIPGMWSQMIKISADELIGSIFKQTITILIGKNLGSADVALYQVAQQIADGVMSPVTFLGHTMMSEFIFLRDHGLWKELKKLTYKIYLFLSAFALGMFLLTYLCGQYIASILLSTPANGIMPTMLLLLGATVTRCFLMPLDPILLMSSQALKIRMRCRFLLVIGYFVLFPTFLSFGLHGVASENLLEGISLFAICFAASFHFIKKQELGTYQQ